MRLPSGWDESGLYLETREPIEVGPTGSRHHAERWSGFLQAAAVNQMDFSLPLDYAAIERILPHRYPFLLVDRITAFEPDKRIVGIKNVSLNERYLAHRPGESPVLPPTILTEAVAQVGAIMILAKPENREKLIYFMGIERVRYRRPVYPGDVVEIEALVRRLRSRMGLLRGIARVNGRTVVEGTMTFALGPRIEGTVPQSMARST
jgi:3-hydroxyacyl-[acyl-carrier-protein] dehydratase